MATSIDTPYGVVSWADEVLGEHTVVTVTPISPDGKPRESGQILLSRLIAMTNGDVLPFLPEPIPTEV